MKYLILIITIIIIIAISTGFYIKTYDHQKGEVFIGLAVLSTAFILMPLFIYHRYKDGKINKYIQKK
ncbi:MAG: hypothetical protein HRT66_02730 [Flavobacteriaceae bacterium]|nr:hypothetical protein [Flavobacteriaceae bacterium]